MTAEKQQSALGRFRDPEARARFDRAYDAALAAWSTRPEQLDVETRWGRTHVLASRAARGVPIVLLPAIAVSGASWYADVAALSAGHPAYAVDTMGDVGRSVQTAPMRDATDLSSWLDDVLDELRIERAHLVGLSYGGWAALNQAHRSPGRLASVTAVDPPGALVRPRASLLLRIAPDAIWAKVAKSDAAIHRLLRLLNGGSIPEQPLLDLCVAGLRTFVGKLPPPRRMTDEQLRTIRVPTLLLFGADSPLTDVARAVDRARRLVPHLETETVPDAGHMLPVERPAVFTERLLRFLDAIDATGAAT